MSDLHLIQLQPNNDAQDPAELPLLTFGLEPPNEGGLAQEEGFLGIEAKPDKVAEGTETPMLGDEALEKECIKIEVVSQRQRRTIAVDPDYNVLQVSDSGVDGFAKVSKVYRFMVQLLASGFQFFVRTKFAKFFLAFFLDIFDIIFIVRTTGSYHNHFLTIVMILIYL